MYVCVIVMMYVLSDFCDMCIHVCGDDSGGGVCMFMCGDGDGDGGVCICVLYEGNCDICVQMCILWSAKRIGVILSVG